MSSEEVHLALSESINRLFSDDLFLLKYDVHERKIAHRLAVYLEPFFDSFHVDCEYNNDLDSELGRKRVYYPGGAPGGLVFPDIIVHHRGLNGPENNLLVIEMKKMTAMDGDLDKDRDKLRNFTASDGPSHLAYRWGALLVLGVMESAGQFEIEWCKDGEFRDGVATDVRERGRL